MIKKIGLITSGGDSPGMNACIRAVVLTAQHHGIKVNGYFKGYEGLIDNDFIELKPSDVADIIHRGGTILKTARSERFFELNFQRKVVANLKKEAIQALIIIGGDGSFKGALALHQLCKLPIVGCAGTIDNDLIGTDFTIGYDTAINTVVDAIDKIRDTAQSHERIFVVEVMGRDAGLIALRSALASGADALMVPELKNDLVSLKKKFKEWGKHAKSRIVVVAEGDENGGAYKVAELIKKHLPKADLRVTILGHIQRGGNPSCMERVNASRIGFEAVNALLHKHQNEMIGIVDKKVVYTPFEKAVKHHLKLKPELEALIDVLSH